ncbi:uro-adherence factor A-like [Hoplias malabaricus]|uniref:uro-adherence factor A-like n=1 Tax=Hoplias malabaricus TaxID=27720 RepID=UPI003461A046
MKRKTSKAKPLRLSPNQEAQCVREELERRRKLRVQQVREQERYIALQLRQKVREKRERELQNLAETLQDEWRKKQEERIQSLQKLHEQTLHAVGQGHRDAKQSEPNWKALARKREENQERAAVRHQRALRELTLQRQTEEELHNKQIEARKKALMLEKKRAAKIVSLPHPAPDPIENIGIHTPAPFNMVNREHLSIAYDYIPWTVVDKGADTEQLDAQQAAKLEAQRLDELNKEEACERQEQLEKARLRGVHALQKERVIQESAKLLCELERLQQADLQQRRQFVHSVPAQIFQPLYRHNELRAAQQRELDIAFQDLCTAEREIRGDLVLYPVPEPLPSPSAENGDEDLDVTLEPDVTTCEETEEESAAPLTQPEESLSALSCGQPALRRLLERIRSRREEWSLREGTAIRGLSEPGTVEQERADPESVESGRAEPEPPESRTAETGTAESGPASTENLSIETGSLSDQENRHQKSRHLETEHQEIELTPSLEQDKSERGLKESEESVVNGTVLEESFSETQSRDQVMTPVSSSSQTQRLREYQLRLLEQNRLQRKSIEDACLRLEEYKKKLQLRCSDKMTTQITPSFVTEESLGSVPSVSDGEYSFGSMDISQIHHRFLPTLCQTFKGPESISQPSVKTTKSALKKHTIVSHPVVNAHDNFPSGFSVTHSFVPEPCLNLNHAQTPVSAHVTIPTSHQTELRDDASSDTGEFDLPSPSVFLEILRNRSAPVTHLSQDFPQRPDVVKHPTVVPTSSQNSAKPRQEESVLRQQINTLQALLRAENTKNSCSSSEPRTGHVTLMETPQNERRTPLTHTSSSNERNANTPLPVPESIEPHVCETASGERMKIPVFRPPRSFQALLRHELSTIQEVDTPADITQNTGTETFTESLLAESSEPLESGSVPDSDTIVGSGENEKTSSGSEIQTSQNSTSRTSRLSWREMLQLESTVSNTGVSLMEQQHLENMEQALLPSGVSAERGYTSSTTISTGSFSCSDHDLNLTITGGHVSAVTAGERSTALCFSQERPDLRALRIHTQELLSTHRPLEYRSFLSTTEQDSFQPLSPEVTCNEMEEYSLSLHHPVEAQFTHLYLGDSTTDTDPITHPTLHSEYLDPLQSDAQSHHALQMSMEQLRISDDSCCDAGRVMAFTCTDQSFSGLHPLSPNISLHSNSPDPIPKELPANENMSGPSGFTQLQQIMMAEKGILEESMISLVSLSDVTLDDDHLSFKEEKNGKNSVQEYLRK